jgi:TniQ
MIEADAVLQAWRDSPELAKSRPWPYRPAPRPDELLSSWFLRVAHGLKLKPYTLAHLTWRSTPPLLTRDIDNFADPRVVGAMAAKTDISASRAWATTLAAYDGLLVERYAPGGRNDWVLQLGVRHRTRNLAGLQYCPACLCETGYYKRAWRLGFVTCCVTHSRRLLDRCSVCSATLEPHRAGALHDCSRCGADLREGEAPTAAYRVIDLQAQAARVLTRGWGRLGESTLGWSHLYFETLRIIAKALAFGPRSEALRSTVVRRWGGDPSPYPWTIGRSLEHLGVADRHRLFDLVAPLIKQWPSRLIEACQEARVWRSWLLRDEPGPPYVLAKVVNDHLSLGFYKSSEAEIRAALAHLRKTGAPVTMSQLRELVGDCQAIPTIFKADAVKRLLEFAEEVRQQEFG